MLEPLYLAADALNLASFGTLGNSVPTVGECAGAGAHELDQPGLHRRRAQPGRHLHQDAGRSGSSHAVLLVPGCQLGLGAWRCHQLVDQGNPRRNSSVATRHRERRMRSQGCSNFSPALLGPLGGLGGILNGLNLTQLVNQQISPLAATRCRLRIRRWSPLSTDPEGDVSTGKHAASADTPVPADTGAEPQHAADGNRNGTRGKRIRRPPTPIPSKDEQTGSTTTSKAFRHLRRRSRRLPRNPVGDVVGGATPIRSRRRSVGQRTTSQLVSPVC